MKLTTAIQESLIAILLHDDTPGGAGAVVGLIPARSYDPYYKDIFLAASEYFESYGKAPGEHALDIFDTLKSQKPDDADIFDRIYESIEIISEEVNRDYVFKQAGAFARHQAMRAGMATAIEALQRNTAEGVEEASAALQSALENSYQQFDPGISFSDTSRSLEFLDMEWDSFPTGIKELDAANMGPARKRLHVFAADTGGGKTWWLIQLAKMAVLNRYRVLYITMELGDDELMGRMMQAMFAVTKRKGEVRRKQFQTGSDGGFRGWVEKVITNRPSFADKKIRQYLTKRAEKFKRRPELLIKEFPAGQLTMAQLKAYLSSLEGAKGFIPDLIIVDAPDNMYHSMANKRLELGQLYVQLKGLAQERNCAVAAVTQANREGGRSRTVTKQHVAEDYSKIGTADIFITFSQTQDEHDLGLARLFVAKGRGDTDKFTVLIAQAFGLGQFALDSHMMVRTYWDYIDDRDEDDEDDDE